MKKVTESPEELLKKGIDDLAVIQDIIKNNLKLDDGRREMIGFHAQQAVEKTMKSYLRYNKQIVEHGHNLDKYYQQILLLNKNIDVLKKSILFINNFRAEVRYTEKMPISNQNISTVLSGLKEIFSFSDFTKLAVLYERKDIEENISNIDFNKMIKNLDYIVELHNKKEVSCLSYTHTDEYNLTIIPDNKGCIDMFYDLENLAELFPQNARFGKIRKIISEDNKGNKYYFLEVKYKEKENDTYKAELWEMKDDFTDDHIKSSIEYFKKCLENSNDHNNKNTV